MAYWNEPTWIRGNPGVNYPFSLQQSASLPTVFFFSSDGVDASGTMFVSIVPRPHRQDGPTYLLLQVPQPWPHRERGPAVTSLGPFLPFRNEPALRCEWARAQSRWSWDPCFHAPHTTTAPGPTETMESPPGEDDNMMTISLVSATLASCRILYLHLSAKTVCVGLSLSPRFHSSQWTIRFSRHRLHISGSLRLALLLWHLVVLRHSGNSNWRQELRSPVWLVDFLRVHTALEHHILACLPSPLTLTAHLLRQSFGCSATRKLLPPLLCDRKMLEYFEYIFQLDAQPTIWACWASHTATHTHTRIPNLSQTDFLNCWLFHPLALPGSHSLFIWKYCLRNWHWNVILQEKSHNLLTVNFIFSHHTPGIVHHLSSDWDISTTTD